jgi:pyruvate/2-oxoglutarate dehydrogenase complex dihydrolipoamide acyltransferase (E2) component
VLIRRDAPRASGYRVERYPRDRLLVLDTMRFAQRVPTMHGLIEVDVTAVCKRMRAHPRPPTVTAIVLATVARAVLAHPEVNVRKAGRRLIRYDDVSIGLTVERDLNGAPFALPCLVRQAATKSCEEISAEIQAARAQPVSTPGDLVGMRWITRIPRPVRRAMVRLGSRVPGLAAGFGSPVVMSSLGMFGQGGGWGIPLSPATLMVTVGAVVRRPALDGGQVVERDYLPLTLSFDHAVIDGAPAARFAKTLRGLLETGAVLA